MAEQPQLSQRDILHNSTSAAISAAIASTPANLRKTAIATAINDYYHHNSHPHLLGLPAELRNHIYELALVEGDEMTIRVTGPDQPPLLKTCHLIRQEALSVYYNSNEFTLHVGAFDGVSLIPFWRLLVQHRSSEVGHKVNLMHTLGQRSWPNLREWLKAVYHDQMASYAGDPLRNRYGMEPDVEMVTVKAMFKIVGELKDVPWSQVQKVLESSRCTLIKLHQEWAKD